MGKFTTPKVREYSFASLEQIVTDICEEINDHKGETFSVGLILTKDDVPKFTTALLSTGKLNPMWLEYQCDEYDYEYHIVLESDGCFWLSKVWNEENERYYNCIADMEDLLFVSRGINEELYNKIMTDANSIVLFDIEE